MAIQSVNPQLKAGLAILRDSCLLAVGLTVIVTLVSDNLTPAMVLRILAEILVYTVIIMYLAYGVFARLWLLVCDRSDTVQWTVFVVVMVAISAVGSMLGSLVIVALNLVPEMSAMDLFAQSFKVCAIVSLMVGVNEAASDRLRSQLEDTKLKLRTGELERERALKLAAEAQLVALESRLHPHFIFNTLNSIASLIPTDPLRAERMVERMAALLRFSMESHQGGLIAFDQEMRIVRDYLEIEQARLGARLRWGLETHDDTAGLNIPPLSIQTLVENSIKFAVAPSLAGGEIRISSERSNGCLHVNVADTGPGFALESAPAGHGLHNLRSRLTVLFGEAADLTASRSNGWTTVSMKVPI